MNFRNFSLALAASVFFSGHAFAQTLDYDVFPISNDRAFVLGLYVVDIRGGHKKTFKITGTNARIWKLIQTNKNTICAPNVGHSDWTGATSSPQRFKLPNIRMVMDSALPVAGTKDFVLTFTTSIGADNDHIVHDFNFTCTIGR